MATEDKNKPLLVATTPSLGARLWIERDDAGVSDLVCLHIGNEGGRGTARYLVKLPVKRTAEDRLESVQKLSELRGLRVPGGDPQGLWQRHLREPPVTLPTPFSDRYTGDDWRATSGGEPWVLVLALFANPKARQPSDGIYTDDDIVGALEDFFSRQPHQQHVLRRGLVYLAATDRPPASHPVPPVSAAIMATGVTEPALQPVTLAFTFALASCQYPAGLVDGTPQAYGEGSKTPPGPADASMLRLAARLDGPDDRHRPSLLVLTGDQIYADATAGLFDPRAGRVPAPRSSIRDAEDWLRVPYQNWYGSVGAQAVLGRVLSLMMLDDHEIDNNWEPVAAPARPGTAERLDRLLAAGSLAYQRYQRDLRKSQLLPHLWHTRLHRGIAFFMADTRTEREARHAAAKPCRPCIMSAHQTTELLAWIEADVNKALARPAFIVSPAMLLPRRRSSLRSLRAALHSDAWDGYPGSLHHLLVQLWLIGRSNLVFLSGDEHLSCVVKATVTKLGVANRAVTLHSVHSSGLYSPYPFANAVPALFALPDDWTFEDPHAPGQHYRCVVEPCGLDAVGKPWAPGDGFALLALAPPAATEPQTETETETETMAGAAAAAWQLDVRFDRATPWAQRCAQAPAPSVTTAACSLTLAPGPGRYQPPSA